eukprot:SAG25_NODE_1756_length_2391_cov_2.729930_3_plen_79_part_00
MCWQNLQMANQLRKELGLTTEQALQYGRQATEVAAELGITPQHALQLVQVSARARATPLAVLLLLGTPTHPLETASDM